MCAPIKLNFSFCKRNRFLTILDRYLDHTLISLNGQLAANMCSLISNDLLFCDQRGGWWDGKGGRKDTVQSLEGVIRSIYHRRTKVLPPPPPGDE